MPVTASKPFGVLFWSHDGVRAATLHEVPLAASEVFLVVLLLLPVRPWWSVAAAGYAVLLVSLAVAVVWLPVARAWSLD